MLVSHRKRFIYMKTIKTAGTSVESYFEQYCMRENEWKFMNSRDQYVTEAGIIGFRGVDPPIGVSWYNHMPAKKIRELIGNKIWNNYFKFCVIRNPYDKLISAFCHFIEGKSNQSRSLGQHEKQEFYNEKKQHIDRFRKWVRNGHANIFDRDKYVIDHNICVDFIIRYEELEAGIKHVCDVLNIPFTPENLPTLKSEYRIHKIDLSEYYDDVTINIVAKNFQYELNTFGYTFPAPKVDHITIDDYPRQKAEELNRQGEKLSESGEYELAIKSFSEAQEILPGWIIPINNLGVVHWQMNNYHLALSSMVAAYQMDPDYRDTVQNLIDMTAALNQQESAFLIARTYLKKHPEEGLIQSICSDLRPTIRIIHHMARSGGTILSKCLGCMNDVLLLSEVHPKGMNWFDPLVQAQRWFNLLSYEEVNRFKPQNLSFLERISIVYERAVGMDKKLILRDWSHLDFTGVPFVKEPGFELSILGEIEKQFNVLHLATVRHPIDQWLSLRRLPIMKDKLTLYEFLHGYRQFAETAKSIGFIRYEDFTVNPESVLKQICNNLDIGYDAAFINKWSSYTTITGDTNNQRVEAEEIKKAPRRLMEPDLLKKLEDCEDYWLSLRILSYNHCEG